MAAESKQWKRYYQKIHAHPVRWVSPNKFNLMNFAVFFHFVCAAFSKEAIEYKNIFVLY